MVHKWKIKIPELSGDEDRGIYLFLPESYDRDPSQRYPVLYMFDGHNVFFDSDATYGKSWGMKEYMEETDTQLIIAAVECSHSPDYGRLKEYSPYDFTDPAYGTITAKGDQTMDWLIHTFKSQLDLELRTLPDRENTWIAGSSMGGLMSLYAVLQYNEVFGRAAALSPSLWTAFGKLQNLARRAKISDDTVIYMDYGSEEFGNHADMRRGFAKMAEILTERPGSVNIRVIPGGTHCEASWERQIPFFMNTLFYGE